MNLVDTIAFQAIDQPRGVLVIVGLYNKSKICNYVIQTKSIFKKMRKNDYFVIYWDFILKDTDIIAMDLNPCEKPLLLPRLVYVLNLNCCCMLVCTLTGQKDSICVAGSWTALEGLAGCAGRQTALGKSDKRRQKRERLL